MVFLGVVMMPFYYGSRVRSVPEFLLRRFNPATHLFNAVTFALAAVLIAGVNLYALALVINALIGWPIWLSIAVSALFVLAYIRTRCLTRPTPRSTRRCSTSTGPSPPSSLIS
jgi:solute:Na+ symporter, SSS family